MKRSLALACLLPLALHAHTLPSGGKEALRAHILEEFMQKSAPKKVKPVEAPIPKTLKRPVTVAGLSGFDLSSFLTSGSALPPAGNGLLMAASFAPFKPKVRYNWDGTTFFLESDNTPEGMPNKMFGITTWQQQVPIPAAYFAHSTSNENNAGSLGYQQPNVWRIPLVPVPSASPIVIYNPPAPPTNFLRGAVALASNGIAIFNPSNNGGNVSYEIGELDYYGGHCGLADDYHYHIAPTHLNTRFGGPLGDDKPIAWALDGYPMYGFLEPDGSPRQALDAEGGHDHGGGWGYHYHAMGTTTVDATHPYGTPQSPYLMKAFHGTVVNFGNQVDGQPAVGNLRADGTGGYNAKAVAGAYIVAQMNPAPLVTDGSGHLSLVAGVNLTGCATTYGSTTVTCASTTGLTTGLAVVGYGVSNGARVTSVTNATQFVLSIPAIATTTGKNFTAVSMATASPDAHVMRVNMGGVDYDECWTINRKVNPRSLTMTWRAQALVGGVLSGPVLTTTQTYTPTAGSASGNRLTAYPMGAWSEVKLPDTSQVVSTTTTFGEDSDYTTTPSANPQSFTDNGDGTITDNVTGLMWQKADGGEMTWENAVNNAGTVTTGGYSDWRLPNPHELMSLFNYETGNPAMNATYFPPASPSAEYWWSRDVFGTSTTNVWCVNSGGGVGPKPKAETVSAGGTLRYHARYVRLAQNNMTHNYVNNLDCTITDTDTSLMWTQMPSTAMTWEAALAWAEGLTLGGYNDWRMPNIKELQTLTDYSLATTSGGTATNLKPAINRTMFAKTMSGCSVTSGSPVVATSDTTDLAVGMTVIDPFSIAGTYINHTTTPTITAINPGVSFTLSSNALSTGAGLIFRALPRATAYWSSTSLKGNTTEAWLLELGVNTAVTPPRGAQGIISYQAKSASFPVFAVRSVPAGSVTQGLATTTTSNLFPPGQRVSAVGTITATDNTTWTVPAATLYTSAEKAPDLYNEYNSVTPANLAAAQAVIAALPTKVIDADGEVVTGYIFADNYFELYVNGVLVGVDPVPFTAFNSCVVKFKAKRPITYAVRLVDWEENLGLGTELNGGDPHHIGDGGFIASFSDGTVTGSDWKAQTFYIAPLDDPNQVVELANGTRSSAGATHNLTTTAYAMHYPLPGGWFSSGFSTAGWPAATTYSEAQVGVNFPAYMNFQPQFTGSGAQFIWSSSLTLDNEVVLRYTGPATTPTQIGVEQPAGTPLADGASTVAYGSVSIGSTLTKTFTIRNNGSTTLSITGVTVDGVNAANFSVTAAPASSIAAGATTTMDVRFDASSGGAKTAALHIACSDPAVGAAFDIELTGTGLVPPPTISNITINPISPSSTDSPFVTAQVTPGAGGSVSSVQLSFDIGGQTTSTVLNETMTSTETATGGWDGSGGAVPWTVQTSNGQGNIQQKLTANHTAAGQGGTCGVQLSKGDSAAANSITTTNAIDIGTATSAAIELWTSVSNINATGLGWSLQLATDASGTNWTTVLSELNVANHGFTKFHYDLTAGQCVSTLRMRFNFFGNGTGGGTGPKVLLDDITLVATTGNPPTTITMYDDGLHGDGAAGDGVYGATIPAQTDGATVNFTIAATGTGGAGTTTSSTTSYTVAPAPTITTTSPLPGGSTTGAYSQTFAATGGSGTGYVWSLFSGSLPNGLTLSSGGVLSGTPTQAGNFNFTIEVTDSANRSSTKAFVLTITTVTAPNVLIILTDDQGWGDIGYHTPAGQVPIQTPRMDGFLSSGIRLENFYATTVCSVTRATLMTGRNQLRTGVNNTHGLALSEHIMPQTFKAAGYQTYMCGKWHIGGSDKNLGYTTVNGQNVRVIQEGLEYAPFNRGWDLHYGQYSGAIQYSTHNSNEALNPDLPDWWLNGVQQDGPSEHTDSQGHGGYSTDLLADKAVSCIQNRDPSKPMLLWLAFNAIHGPVSAPAEYLAKYSSITNTNRRTIAAAVDCMDAAIGRVLDQLTASGIADNTIVVFMSDNGGQESGGSLNDPLRGTKGDSWDGGVHLPAAISWPGVLATNVVSKQYVWVGDIFPTLCAATGVTAQNTQPFDGLNLWPALLSINSGNPDGQARPLDKPLVTISAAPIALNRFTDPVNGGEKVFKLIRNKVGQSVVNELYNMTDDVDPATGAPIESTDLLLGPNAAAYSAIVTSLTTAITDITPINYPPYIGPPLITNTVSEGGNITLYAPFSSWPKTAPTVQWRKNGVNIPGGTFAQVMDIDSVVVAGGYAAKLDLTGVTAADAGSYDVVITNAGGTTTSASGVLTVTMPAPALTLPAFTKGTSITLNWTAVPGATGYTIQRSTTSDFASVTPQTTSSTSVTFSGLTSGTTYYYRGTATDGTATSAFGNTASSTQDASTPVVTITAPANNTTTTANSIIVSGTATDTISPLPGLTVNGVNAVTTDAYATWTAIVDSVTTLDPGNPATVGVSFDGSNVRFTFGIPRGNDGSNGSDGSQGPPGEISQAQLDSAISGTSANTNGVSTLDSAFADPDMEAIRQKLNEMILNGRR